MGKSHSRSGGYALGSMGKSGKSHPSSGAWDGSNSATKSTQVQCRGRQVSSTGSEDTDEIPLGVGTSSSGIKREIEFSVEADSRSNYREAGGWGPDLERNATGEDGPGREAGRMF